MGLNVARRDRELLDAFGQDNINRDFEAASKYEIKRAKMGWTLANARKLSRRIDIGHSVFGPKDRVDPLNKMHKSENLQQNPNEMAQPPWWDYLQGLQGHGQLAVPELPRDNWIPGRKSTAAAAAAATTAATG